MDSCFGRMESRGGRGTMENRVNQTRPDSRGKRRRNIREDFLRRWADGVVSGGILEGRGKASSRLAQAVDALVARDGGQPRDRGGGFAAVVVGVAPERGKNAWVTSSISRSSVTALRSWSQLTQRPDSLPGRLRQRLCLRPLRSHRHPCRCFGMRRENSRTGRACGRGASGVKRECERLAASRDLHTSANDGFRDRVSFREDLTLARGGCCLFGGV